MDFRLNSEITISSILYIVLHLTIQFVQAKFPNEDILAAAPCIKQYLGDKFVDQPFLEEGDVLSGGEYFGAFCSRILFDLTDEKVQQHNKGEDEIKSCLALEKKQYVFRKYRNQWAPTAKRLQTWLGGLNRKSNDENLPKTSVMKFFIGICNAKEYLEFDALEKDDDKNRAEKCTLTCADKFLYRIRQKLVLLKSKLMESLQNEMEIENEPKEENNSSVTRNTEKHQMEDGYLKETYEESIRCLENKMNMDDGNQTFEQMMQSKTVKDIKIQTDEGKNYLFNYAKIYDAKKLCPPKNFKLPTIFLQILDIDLNSPDSTPFMNIIETEAKRSHGQIFFRIIA